MTEEEARAELERMVQHDVAPILTEEDVDALMAIATRVPYPAWAASTAYAAGDRVVPAARNGHVYLVTIGGDSGAAAPSWPTDKGGTVTDGEVTWQEAGGEPLTATYHLNAAAAEGWRRKAGKVVPDYSFSIDNQRSNQSEVYQHCLSQAEHYAGLVSSYLRIR